MHRLRVALAQINPTVGDIQGNCELIRSRIREAREAGVDVVAFPELAITGYPPEDLLLKPCFVDDNLSALRGLAPEAEGITVIVGFVDKDEDIYNAAAVLHDGEVAGTYHKTYLPNYSVFDENRYFQQGDEVPIFRLGGVGIGVSICEDIWYPTGPAAAQAMAGAEVLINISASPYRCTVPESRERMLRTRAQDSTACVCFVNTVGGQDELVFDGYSAVYGPEGEVIARAPAFRETLLVADLDVRAIFRQRLHDPRLRKLVRESWSRSELSVWDLGELQPRGDRPEVCPGIAPLLGQEEEMYEALVLAMRDYARKTHFEKAVIALSGGIDSSLVAAIAVDALGPENVVGVSMPSRYSSEGSRTDAEQLAENLGIELLRIPIEGPFTAFLEALSGTFEGTAPDVAEENLQARCRGVIMMALANKFGWRVITTGNKSEGAVGYATLYGDTAGGFALIKDLPKTDVYRLSRYRNSREEVIPRSVLEKAPSAELRPNQTDQDTLPPYEVLDLILEEYVEGDRSVDEIAALGFDRETVARVIRMVDAAEHKRRQSPHGPKVTPRAFGRDRRLPVANGYRVS